MTDAFALLGLPRRPWLNPDDVQRSFHERSAAWHPDRHHGEPDAQRLEAGRIYAELNAAHQLLREPRDRLLHLFEIESGSRPRDIQRIPPGTMDLFVEVGQTCRDCDAFLQRRDPAASPMLKLKSMKEAMEWADRLSSVLARVKEKESALLDELRGMNAAWDNAPSPGDSARLPALPMDRLEQCYRALSYVSRWIGQVRERVVQIATTS